MYPYRQGAQTSFDQAEQVPLFGSIYALIDIYCVLKRTAAKKPRLHMTCAPVLKVK